MTSKFRVGMIRIILGLKLYSFNVLIVIVEKMTDLN